MEVSAGKLEGFEGGSSGFPSAREALVEAPRGGTGSGRHEAERKMKRKTSRDTPEKVKRYFSVETQLKNSEGL